MENNVFFNSDVLALLKQAGWFPGRNVGDSIDYPSDVVYPIEIRMLLHEYGKLKVKSSGPGVNMVRNSIDFDPSWAEQESSEDGKLKYYSDLLNKTLYPLGYISNESLFLCIDLKENIYMAGDNLYWMGESFVNGVSNILLGIAGKSLNEESNEWM